MAGHTHGGQLCLPFFGAIVTNCELDRSRVKGPSVWGNHMKLHVGAGLAPRRMRRHGSPADPRPPC